MTIFVHGLGHVGLTLAIALAIRNAGRPDVALIGVDPNKALIETLRAGKMPIHEENGDTYLKRVMEEYLLHPILDANVLPAEEDEVHVVCVGTPPDRSLSHFDAVIDTLAARRPQPRAIVIRSTVPIGTTARVAARFPDTEVTFCPERTIEGRAIQELFTLPQIIAGPKRRVAEEVLGALSDSIVPMERWEEGEAVKLLDNCWRDATFGLANAFAHNCARMGLRSPIIFEAAKKNYPRAAALPMPGPAGGPCLTKDPGIWVGSVLQVTGDFHYSVDVSPIWQARQANERLYEWVLFKIHNLVPTGGTVWVRGMAFKHSPPTKDTRGSVYEFLKKTLGPNYKVVGYDWWELDVNPPTADCAVLVDAVRGGDVHRLDASLPIIDLWGNSPLDRPNVIRWGIDP